MTLSDAELVARLVQQKLDEMGLTAQLERVKGFVEATDRAFALIESDPHSWSTRPCLTCQSVTALTGRDFGCVRKALAEKRRDDAPDNR